MPPSVRILRHEHELPGPRGPWQGVFVPTMGALHEGHASLIRQAAQIASERHAPHAPNNSHAPPPVIVSIFVNPTQFNDPGDFARYPKTLDADLELCAKAGATAVFVPDVATIYPQGMHAAPDHGGGGGGGAIQLPAVATQPGLEDALRPGHFAGVCQVVARLFELIKPAVAVFGEKDWQQLQVVRALARERGYPITIIPSQTIREPDGLAMSSRNRFIAPQDRPRAAAISQALRAADRCFTIGEAERVMRTVLEREGLEIQYAVVREAHSLLPRSHTTPGGPRAAPMRSLIAVRLGGGGSEGAGGAGSGSVRLIDNAPWRGLSSQWTLTDSL